MKERARKASLSMSRSYRANSNDALRPELYLARKNDEECKLFAEEVPALANTDYLIESMLQISLLHFIVTELSLIKCV